MGAACCGSHRYVAASKAPTPVVCLRARKLPLSSTHISPGQDVVGRVLAGLARLRAQPRLRAFAKQFHHGGVVLVALARRVDGVQPLPEGRIGLGIQVAVAVQVKLTEVCPARAATSLGLARPPSRGPPPCGEGRGYGAHPDQPPLWPVATPEPGTRSP